MKRAIECSRLLSGHAEVVFQLMGSDPAIEAAKHLLNWIERGKLETFTARDAHRAVMGRYPRRQQDALRLKALSLPWVYLPHP